MCLSYFTQKVLLTDRFEIFTVYCGHFLILANGGISDGLRIQITTPIHPIGVVISDSRNILHRIISLQKKRKLETNPIPTCLASVV